MVLEKKITNDQNDLAFYSGPAVPPSVDGSPILLISLDIANIGYPTSLTRGGLKLNPSSPKLFHPFLADQACFTAMLLNQVPTFKRTFTSQVQTSLLQGPD